MTLATIDTDRDRIPGSRTITAPGTVELLAPYVSYRQVDYWTTIELFPLAVDADGAGSRRRLDLIDVLRIRALALFIHDLGRSWSLRDIAAEIRRAPASTLVDRFTVCQGRVSITLDLSVTEADEPDLAEWMHDERPALPFHRRIEQS